MTTPWWATLIGILVTGGLFSYIRDAIRGIRFKMRESTPEAKERQKIHDSVVIANESMLAVATSRKELEADNARLRQELNESAARHATERREWLKERTDLRSDIQQMEDELGELQEKLRSTLEELSRIRIKHQLG